MGRARFDEIIALYAELRWIDDTPMTGSGRGALLRATPGATDPEVWFFDMRADTKTVKMELDYPGYLEAVLVTKGVIGWQYLYCDPADCGLRFSSCADGLEGMIEYFPRLFPEHDYTDLSKRLAERL